MAPVIEPPTPAQQGETLTPEPEAPRRNPWLRVGASVLAVALIPAALLGLLLVLVAALSSAQEPNPFIADGFMCCTHPDTWTEVGVGTLVTGLLVGLTVLSVLAMVSLFAYADGGRWFGWGTLLQIPAMAGGATVVGMALLIAPQAGSARTPPDCDALELQGDLAGFADGGFSSSPSRAKEEQEQVMAVAACDTVDGKTPAEVKAQLGAADSEELDDPGFGQGEREYVDYGILRLTFENGRVVDSTLVSPASG